MRPLVVTFYTRLGCALCSEAIKIVDSEVKRASMALTVIDVDNTPRLADAYGTRVPVVLGPNQRIIAEGRINKRQLRKALRKF